MILKGRPRAHGGQLADYLLSPKNEQVQILDVCGTISDDRTPDGLKQSLREMDEMGKMTRAKASLFHLAINPHERDQMTPEDWQHSVTKAEKALGLTDHPRAVVSHIYQGKEHFHVVWSRVDVETRKCAELSFSHLKLCQTAREIEIERGLMPTPLRARGATRPKQQAREIEGHQAERAAPAQQERRAAISTAWNQAETGKEFQGLVEAAGFQLSVGRRGVVVMDAHNEAHSIPRCVPGLKAKDVQAKLADLEDLLTVEQQRRAAKQEPARKMKADIKAQAPSSQTGGPEIANDNQQSGLTPRRGHKSTAQEMRQELTAGDDNIQSGNAQNKPVAPLRPAETLQQFKARHWERLEEEQRQKERERQRPGYEMEM